MLVFFRATQRRCCDGRTRANATVVDETSNLLSGEDSQAFIEGAARGAREYCGALPGRTRIG